MNKDSKDKLNTLIKLLVIASILLGTTLIIVEHFDTIYKFIAKVARLSSGFMIGLFIAYILTPLTNKLISMLEKSKLKNKSYTRLNTISIVIVETLFISAVVSILSIVVIGVAGSGYNILMKLPKAFDQFTEMLDKQLRAHELLKSFIGNSASEAIEGAVTTFGKFFEENFEDIISGVLENTWYTGKNIVNWIMGLIVSIFALANRAQFKRQSIKIVKAFTSERVTNKIIDIAKNADKKFSKFFIGKIIDSIIVGIICVICMSILKMPYIALVSIIVMITNIVPIVGPFIGAIPSIIIIFSESPIQAVYFTIFIIILQQIDGHIIGPKCIGSATGLNTFYVLFALIVSGGLWGIVGMVVGVPLFSVIYSLISDLVNWRIEIKSNKNNAQS